MKKTEFDHTLMDTQTSYEASLLSVNSALPFGFPPHAYMVNLANALLSTLPSIKKCRKMIRSRDSDQSTAFTRFLTLKKAGRVGILNDDN